MTSKQVVEPTTNPPPMIDASALNDEFFKRMKFNAPTDEDMNTISAMRATSHPWKDRGESQAESLEALSQLRPFTHVAKESTHVIGYVTVERDGPVPGAAYMRNIVVRPDLRRKGLGKVLLEKALNVARDMNRKTLALRVDPANAPAVGFYRREGFTTVQTVVSKKNGKLRLLMSKEL